MTALATDRPLEKMVGELTAYPVGSNTLIYEGSMIGIVPGTGYARPWQLGDLFVGHSPQRIDNRDSAPGGGAAGQRYVPVYRGVYWLSVALPNVAITSVGAPVFAADSGTYSLEKGQLVGTVHRYESSGKAIVEFQPAQMGAAGQTVERLSETLLFSEFTDGGSTSGYRDFATQIPGPALVLGWHARVDAGFIGNVSAVVSVGVSGAVGAFSADTAQSCFTTNNVIGSAPVAATAFRPAATTPRVTVTSGTDFTAVSAGDMNLSLLYLPLN